MATVSSPPPLQAFESSGYIHISLHSNLLTKNRLQTSLFSTYFDKPSDLNGCNVYTLHPAPTPTTQRLCLRLSLCGTEPSEEMANDVTKREGNRDGFSHSTRNRDGFSHSTSTSFARGTRRGLSHLICVCVCACARVLCVCVCARARARACTQDAPIVTWGSNLLTGACLSHTQGTRV